VLDLATGNGAIAVMAVEAGNELEVTGSDLADVRPDAFVSKSKGALGRVNFLPNTPAEQLPFANASFDAVVSQYGIEYSHLDQSVPEAARVLAPGGRLRFATHAAEGSVVANTRRAVEDANFLLDEVDLIGKATVCITAILDIERGRAKGPFAPVEAQQKYAAFRDALRAVAERAGHAADADMLVSVHRSLTDLFQQRQSHADEMLQARITDLCAEVEAHRERERALLAAALSRDELTELVDQLADFGLSAIKLSEQRDGGELIGHIIEGRRLVD
jgi:ubiquinone/menaquinone biosynthesis C-methylase UbiE